MGGRQRSPAQEMRIAIDCLPLDTRHAMLDGIERNRIIVGAYVDRDGGVCPMLAAHRNGGRTSLASFARAWDRYTRAGKRSRPASERELRTLRVALEASIALDEAGGLEHISRAVAQRRVFKAHPKPRSRRRRETGERDRTRELRGRPGWAWLKPFRRLDEYARALHELDDARRARDLEGEGRARETELV
jgi:hypothetical protein